MQINGDHCAFAAESAATRAMDGVRRLVRILRSSNADAQRTADLSSAQLFVLTHIAEHPNGSLSEVAARTLTTQSTASEVVARLVDRGLVSRAAAPDDRRRVALSATPFGRRALQISSPPIQSRLIASLACLPLDQQLAIADGLEAWLEIAGFDRVAPSMFFEPERAADAPAECSSQMEGYAEYEQKQSGQR